ncbi:MAG: hypothetical protein IJ555_12045 [Ruminococcus sp.]|nr:hypothetical protein [Ruminococcus sp.]
MSKPEESRGSDTVSLAPLVGRLCRAMVCAGAVCFLFTLFWGFELRNLLGFAVGTANACGGMIYLSKTVERAVELDTKRAKRLMLTCYGTRLAILTLLCAFALSTGILSAVGIIVPQLYPRILLSFDRLLGIDHFGKG